jgi:hypothetical protein
MPVSPDGVLTANFDPTQNLVSLLVDGSEWLAPGVLRTNLCPNPRFIGTDGTTGGGSTSWTQEDLPTGAPDGRGFTRFTVTADATGPVEIGTDLINVAAVTPGETYAASLYGRQSRPGGTQIVIAWLDSGGAQLGQSVGESVDAPAGQWVRHEMSGTAPASTAYAAVRWYVPPAVALAGDTLDAAQRMVGPDGEYFDGGTAAVGGRQYSWTGTVNRSESIEEWTYAVPDEVSVYRSVDGGSRIAVRGAEMAAAPGGTFVWSDNEAPLDASVTYTVEGYVGGQLVGMSSVTVQTVGAKWGAWLKVPGRPELTTLATVRSVGDQSRATLGGAWQIPGGPQISQSGAGALAQSAGMGALAAELVLTTKSPSDLAALQRAVRQAPGQVVLIQTAQPEELPSGYYFVSGMSTANPTNLRSDLQPLRWTTLALTEAVMPAGPASGWTGVTYTDVANAFETYQDLDDSGLSYLDLATGEGWG